MAWVDCTATAETQARDAARYRWLRDLSEPGICAFYLSVGHAFKGVRFAKETVDAAIDAQLVAAETSAGNDSAFPTPKAPVT
jgi:hypothetical protein